MCDEDGQPSFTASASLVALSNKAVGARFSDNKSGKKSFCLRASDRIIRMDGDNICVVRFSIAPSG